MRAVVLESTPLVAARRRRLAGTERGFRPGHRARARRRHLRFGPGAGLRCTAPARLPWVPGHEAIGEIVAAGAGRGRVPGRPARRHRAELPVPALPRVPVRADLDVPGPGARRLHRAGHAGRVRGRLPAAYAWPVPDRWADGDAVCAEPLTVALAAIRRSGSGPGGRCLVVGAGLAGRRCSAWPWSPTGSLRTCSNRTPAGSSWRCRSARRRPGPTTPASHGLRDVRGGGGPRRGRQPGRARGDRGADRPRRRRPPGLTPGWWSGAS